MKIINTFPVFFLRSSSMLHPRPVELFRIDNCQQRPELKFQRALDGDPNLSRRVPRRDRQRMTFSETNWMDGESQLLMEFEWRGTDYDPSQLPRFFTDRRCEFFLSRLPVLDNLSSFELLLGAAASRRLFFFGAEENVNCTREAISSRKNIQIGNFTIVAGEIRNYELPSSRAAIKLRRNQVMCGESNLGA